MTNARKRIALVLVAIGLSTGLCELAIQLGARVVPFVAYQISPPWTRNLVPDRLLGSRMSPYYPGHDRRGYRNDDALERYDMVAIGDSTTYGFGAAPDGSWPRQLRNLSGKPVYNAGVGGYGPCEYDVVLDELLALRPHTIIVGVLMANDIANAYSSVYIDHRCQDLRTSDASVLAGMTRADDLATLNQVAGQYGETSGAAPAPTLLQRSALYGLARSLAYQLRTTNRLPFREGRDDSFEASAQRPFRVAMDAPAAFRTVFVDPRGESLGVDVNDPRIAEGLQVTFRALRAMRDKLAGRDTSLIVVLLHGKAFVLGPLIQRSRADLWPRFDRLVGLETEATRRISEWLSANGIRFIDTGDSLQRSVDLGVMPFHESDDHHPNALGYRLIAETIWRQIGGGADRRIQ